MRERPILFSSPMVRAILEGRKTQTRRVIKPQPSIDDQGNFCWNGSNFGQDFNGPRIQAITSPLPSRRTGRVLCPYGKPGDRLWVRETWQGPLLESDEQIDEFRQSPDTYKKPGFCAYRATDTLDAIDQDGKELGWRPSIHMPRWASRILLEVTDVRVERLQDISEADAVAEGVRNSLHLPGGRFAKENFEHLWWTINGDGSWDANPWVWVVEFKRLEGGAA